MGDHAGSFWLLVMTAWMFACGVKTAVMLSQGSPYVFGLWDGGMLRAGKSVAGGRVWIKLAVSILAVIIALARLAGFLAPVPSLIAIVVVLGVGMISDFTSPQ